MAPTVTVLSVRTDEKTRLEQLVVASQSTLVLVDAALTQAKDDATTQAQALAALQAAESTLRQQLAQASMPADIDLLDTALETNLLQQGPAAALLAAAQDTVAKKERERTRVATAGDLARAQLAQAVAAVTLAKRDDDQANAWRAALGGPALQSMVANAKGATVTGYATNATNTLGTLLGGKAELLTLVQNRYADAQSAAADRDAAVRRATDALDAVVAERSAVDGAVATTGEAFARARAAARTVAEQGEQQLAAATAILQAAAGAAPVTLSEQGRINTRAAAAAPNPASHEKDVHVAAVALRDAQAALEAKVLPAKALDPTYDPTDPHAVPDVTALLTAVDTAQGKVTDAANAFIGADKTAIDNWEVALPPPLMLLLPDVLRALAVVDRLANRTDLVAVAKALDDSETAYAQALQQQSVRQQHADAAAAEVAARLDDVAAVAPVLDLRVAALVRGDQ